MLLRPLLCLACLAPAVLRAECPTAADMAGGVEVTFANGDVTILRAVGEGMIEVTELYSWAPAGRSYFAYLGIYVADEEALLPDGSQDPESRVTTVYPVPVTEMPVPAPETADWEGQLRRDIGTDEGELAEYRVRFAAMEPVEIGGCRYDSVAVGESLRPGQSDQKDQYSYYLPALGAGFIVGWTIDRELHQTEAVAIRAVAP